MLIFKHEERLIRLVNMNEPDYISSFFELEPQVSSYYVLLLN